MPINPWHTHPNNSFVLALHQDQCNVRTCWVVSLIIASHRVIMGPFHVVIWIRNAGTIMIYCLPLNFPYFSSSLYEMKPYDPWTHSPFPGRIIRFYWIILSSPLSRNPYWSPAAHSLSELPWNINYQNGSRIYLVRYFVSVFSSDVAFLTDSSH